jgi:hypothetical protein
MKSLVVALSLVTLTVALHAQLSCLDYGSAVYCSNGLSAIRSGNMMYFSDGTTVQTFGNVVTINNQPTEIAQTNVAASYQAGQAIGAVIGSVIANVRQRRKFYRVCDVNPYAHGWLNGSPAFCSKTAILEACSNVPQLDFSGFKYAGDSPHHLSWTDSGPAGTFLYLPNWPKSDGEIECAPDVATHSTHLAKLWLAHKHEAEYSLRDSHPHLSEDDSARIVNYIYANPDAYDARKVVQPSAAKMFEKIYIAVKATS